MSGIAFHGNGSYATAAPPATFTVQTIPSGSYGTLPTLAIAIGGTWFPDDLDGSWDTSHTIRITNALATLITLNAHATASAGMPAYGGAIVVQTMPTGFLDSGATIEVSIHRPLFSAPHQDAAQVTTVVVAYDASDVRDGTDSFYMDELDFTDPAVGSMSSVPFLGGLNVNNFESSQFGKLVGPDPTAKFALGLLALPIDSSPSSPASWAATNWVDVDASQFDSGLGNNPLHVANAIGFWTRPVVLDTSYHASCALLPFTNGPRNTLVLNNALPLAGGRSFGTILG